MRIVTTPGERPGGYARPATAGLPKRAPVVAREVGYGPRLGAGERLHAVAGPGGGAGAQQAEQLHQVAGQPLGHPGVDHPRERRLVGDRHDATARPVTADSASATSS